MKNTSIIIVILLSILGIGCKKIHCPAFPVEFVNTYLPYYEEKSLSFFYNNDTLSSVVSRIHTSKEEFYSKNCDCSCSADYYFLTDNNLLSCDIAFDEAGYYGYLHIKANAISFYKDFKDINLFTTNDYTVFGDTIFLNNVDGGEARVVKGKGLVSYTTADGEEWKLVE